MPNHCGDCRMCCKVMAVQDLEKPRGKWCAHACDHGCAIYPQRPESCATYSCGWLQSQTEPGMRPMLPALRPDRCGAILNSSRDAKAMAVDFDPTGNKSWHPTDNTPLAAVIKQVSSSFQVIVRRGLHTRVVRHNKVINEFYDNRPPRVAAGLDDPS